MLRAIALAALVLLSRAASAQPMIASAQLEANDRSLVIVTFSPPVAEATVLRADAWQVVLFSAATARNTSLERVAIVTCSNAVFASLVSRCPSGEDAVQVVLQLIQPAPPGITELEVRLTTSGQLSAGKFKQGPSGAAGGFTGAKADDADISFDGKLTKTKDSDGQYDVSLFLGYMRAVVTGDAGRSPSYIGRFGLYGEAETQESPTLDPGSFLAYGVYQRELGGGGFRGLFQTPLMSVRVPGVEFDKSGDQRNIVISPVVTVPFRLSAGSLGVLAPGFTIPHMTLHGGVEIVNSFHSRMNIEGWHLRWLGGATFRTGYAPETASLHSLVFTTSYVVRVLTHPEPHKDPTHAPVDPVTEERGKAPLELGKKARHLVDAEFKYNPVRWVGVSFKYKYGSTPPVFSIKDHTFTVGLAFALKQTSYGRYAILKP